MLESIFSKCLDKQIFWSDTLNLEIVERKGKNQQNIQYLKNEKRFLQGKIPFFIIFEMFSFDKIYQKQKTQALSLSIQIHINVDLISMRQVKKFQVKKCQPWKSGIGTLNFSFFRNLAPHYAPWTSKKLLAMEKLYFYYEGFFCCKLCLTFQMWQCQRSPLSC